MAEKKEKEPVEDKDFWYRLRNEQRDMVRGELRKERLGLGARTKEEEKALEEAKHALEASKTKWRVKKLLGIVLILVIIFILYLLYSKGYFVKVPNLLPPA